MKIALFYHSLISDWNHGNAHFLRGIASELIERGHEVAIYEPENGWSLNELKREKRANAVNAFHKAYPGLQSRFHNDIDWRESINDPDLIIAHEWSSHDLISRLGEYRQQHPSCRLLFHDTHHRAVTDPAAIEKYDLSCYDGVLAYGEILTQLYQSKSWAEKAWTWHEAADIRVFKPHPEIARTRDVIWVGNWGDGERSSTLREFLLQPIADLDLDAQVYGVRYPQDGLDALTAAGIDYGGWLPNFLVPETFASFRVTVHVPRGPYVSQLAGIPTIRPFEALACGIPLISAPWKDSEGLFRENVDYLRARDGAEMRQCLKEVLNDDGLAEDLVKNGRQRILERHTCGHRVDELLDIYNHL